MAAAETTDFYQLQELAWRVLEDTSFLSGLWTVEEIAGYYNQRQNRFNRDTKLVLATLAIPVAADQAQISLPTEWIASLNASWTDAPTGFSSTVGLGDRYAAEKGLSTTNNLPGRPMILDDQSGGPLVGELLPVPTTAGTLDLLYACALEPLRFGLNSAPPDICDLPEDLLIYVVYGVLADMLQKDGRGQDLARAAYCEQRYREGVMLSGILLAGYL